MLIHPGSTVLVVVGARYMGHAMPVSRVLGALVERAPGLQTKVVVAPLNGGDRLPPAYVHFKRCGFRTEICEDLWAPPDPSVEVVATYTHLMLRQRVDVREVLCRAWDFVEHLIEETSPDLIVTDSFPGVPQLGRLHRIPVVAVRSHALIPQVQGGVVRDTFLSGDISDATLMREAELLSLVQRELLRRGSRETLERTDQLYYHCPVVTPGFDDFDVATPYATGHAFFRLGSLPAPKPPGMPTPGVIYIRDGVNCEHVCAALDASGIPFLCLPSELSSTFAPWEREEYPRFMCSHGGHGMMFACLYQEIPHIILADNADRAGNGARLEARGWGSLIMTLPGRPLPPKERIVETVCRAASPTGMRLAIQANSVPVGAALSKVLPEL